MELLSTLAIPVVLALVGVWGLCRHVAVFPVFLDGAKKGLTTAVGILPTMVGMLTAVTMLRASGAIDLLAHALAPVMGALGIPEACAPLVLLKPVSGSGGLAIGAEVMRQSGADSLTGLTAAVMLGASETSIYTISLYAGSLKLPGTRYAIQRRCWPTWPPSSPRPFLPACFSG